MGKLIAMIECIVRTPLSTNTFDAHQSTGYSDTLVSDSYANGPPAGWRPRACLSVNNNDCNISRVRGFDEAMHLIICIQLNNKNNCF